MIITRFAPSPTGYLHVGNVRTALINWIFVQQLRARGQQAQFMLRIDDTDQERSKPEYEAAIIDDMQWLGLTWDITVKQSERFERYTAAMEKLQGAGRLYACYETPEELDIQRKQLSSRGLPPVYNRAGLKLTDAQRTAFEAEGRKAHWRFLLEDGEVAWDDLVRGRVAMKATTMSDPVLVRADGVPVYTLASVVDDGEFNITHVVRGEDHVSNTAVQVQLYQALGFTVPTFGHLSLLKTKEGELSKRLGGNDIRSMREQGIRPMAINSLLARLGTSDPVDVFESMEPLVDSFDWEKFGRAAANYDVAELERLNTRLVRQLSFETVKHVLEALVPEINEAFWESVKNNLLKIQDAASWWHILHGDISASLTGEDRAFLQQAAACLPPEPWDETTWQTWTNAITQATGRKGKALFLPLRMAITGMEHGPEIKTLLPLLGKDKVLKRLN